MTVEQPQLGSTYVNPVYDASFPDPFVLRSDAYYAFCTGFADDGRVFGVIASADLVEWHSLGGAMEPLAGDIAAGDLYWAPEITYHDGVYYLYYSVGNETFMQIRVATGTAPAGPYIDAGRTLTTQQFAIDPHVFIDDDGSWHLFYATDFLDHTHIGTGTVVDRMLDPFNLAGEPRPVTRAKFDWQVYDPARKEKGGVRWHTVEGPFVLKRKGKYFEMFSGGNWQNVTYGVGYAVSDRLYADEEWHQPVDGIDLLPLLRTIPEKVIGPGHNSVITGPNGRELFCVYHRWQDGKRVMCIDRMDFAGGDRLFVAGPSYGPQPRPMPPSEFSFEDTFQHNDLTTAGWTATADTVEFVNGDLRIISGGAEVKLSRAVPTGPFDLSINVRLDDIPAEGPSLTFGCGTSASVRHFSDAWHLDLGNNAVPLPAPFSPSLFHQFRMLNDGRQTTVYLDGTVIGSAHLTQCSGRLEIVVKHATAVLDMVRFAVL